MNLTVVTCFFDPVRSQRMRDNYYRFKDTINAPLYTIQAGFDNSEKLDPDVHFIEANERQRLWQKERLLNLAIKEVNSDIIAWIDADVLFLNQNWQEELLKEMEHRRVVQLFDTAHWLDKHNHINHTFEGFGSHSQKHRDGWAHPGFAWAMYKKDWQTIGGLFDQDIIGSGDTWMMWGWLMRRPHLNAVGGDHSMYEQWRPWARRAKNITRGRIGFVRGDLLHMYHGDRANRAYVDRHLLKKKHNFQPAKDVKIGENGLWEWTGNNPDFEAAILAHFVNRKEDE